MSLTYHFKLMADYNQQMNKSIYNAASALSVNELTEDRGAFFGSIIGTLNHILVGDIVWLKRFAAHPNKLTSLDYVRQLDIPKALDSTLYDDLSELNNVRVKLDNTIIEFAHELTEATLTSALSYRNTKGVQANKNFSALIQHFFNHQTHHRGQISTLLNQMNIDIGVTDLLVCIQDE